jgi:hypothetical protein
MKTKRISSWIVLFFMTMLVVALLVTSCSEESGAGTARVEVRLTDAPGNYDEVIVDIQDVQVNASSNESEGGWVSLDVNKGKYDLLELTNGLDTLLGTAELPAGKIGQIRLVLGEENTVKVDGVTKDLSTPSAQQSGLKVNLNTELEAGKTYVILLDFDAARSIVATGSGMFILKPVIRASAELIGETNEEKGGIEGIVSPASANPVIYAIAGDDSVSTSTNDLGMFAIMNLDTGLYRLVVVPDAAFLPLEMDSVHVSADEVTDVGVLTLEEN